MTPPESRTLRREGEVFALYLTGKAADEYVLEKYEDAHRRGRHLDAGRFDRLLLRLARVGPVPAALADAYAALLARRSTLRKKMILLLAILESCPPERGLSETVESSGLAGVCLGALLRGGLFVLRFFVAAVLLLPCQLALGSGGRSPAGGR